MADTGELPGDFDPEVVHERYRQERDKRLVPGRTDTLDLEGDDHLRTYLEDPFTPLVEREPVRDEVEVTIIGGGIAGVVVGANLRKGGVESIRIVDQAGGVGGTWYWNRYPGIMCDIESYIYMPMLEEFDYIPTERYASGGEILEHIERIANRYGLDDQALFHTGVTRSAWDEESRRWRIATDRGDEFTSHYLILAVGILNLLKVPAIPGMEHFAGTSFHTARWDYGYTGGGPGEPMTELGDKVVGLVGTGATGIQCVEPLADAAEHVYVFQRTPSAIGERGNRPTPPEFRDTLEPGWQQERMDNFETIMLGRPVDEDLIDDGWTHHYAKVQHPPRRKDMSIEEYLRSAEELDYAIMEEHRHRVDELVEDPATAAKVKPYYRYLCKRPCFHDGYLPALNRPNVTLVDCPAGFDEITAAGPVVDGEQYELDCLIYATGFEPELTPLYRRVGHDIVGRNGLTLAEKWADGAASLFGMMIRGFPNLFVMPAPGQQAVVTTNYTHVALLGAEFVADTIRRLDEAGAGCFEVTAEAEEDWTAKIVSNFVDASRVLSACTPSRINLEGRPEEMNPRNGNYGRGLGNYFAYRDLLAEWRASGSFEGLEIERASEGS